jgi:outer membrane lipoprotein-sorting protein
MRALPLLLVLLAACPKPHKPPGPTPSPEELKKKAEEASEKITSFSAEARVDFFDQQAGAAGRLKGTVLFLISRPNKLRFDALLPSGQPAAILASDGENFSLLDLRENRYYRGRPTPENIGRLFRVAFADKDVVRGLLGESPFIEAPEKEKVTFNAKRGEWELRLTRGTLEQTVRYDATSLQLKTSTLMDGEAVVFRITYDKYKPVDGLEGVSLPREIYFEKPQEKSDLLVKIQEGAEANGEVNAEAFTLTPPDGVEILDL